MKKKAIQLCAKSLVTACTLSLIVIIGSAATIVYGADEPVANVSFGSSEIFFDPVLTGENLSLTVGGGGGLYVQMDFYAGETPFFQTSSLPDGNYKYELRTIPETNLEALAEAEQNGDTQRVREISRTEQEQMIVQSGGFQIENSVIIPPSHEEDSVE